MASIFENKNQLTEDNKSILSSNLKSGVKLTLKSLGIDNSKATNIVTNSLKTVLITSPLFMDSDIGYAASFIFNGLNQAENNSNCKTDFILGGIKGILLKASIQTANTFGFNPAMTGIELGFTNTFLNSSLNRKSYYHNDQFSLKYGLDSALKQSLNYKNLGLNALTFAVSDTAYGALNYKTNGLIGSSKLIQNAMTGGIFGFVSQAGSELANKNTNIKNIIEDSVTSSFNNSLAAVIGGSLSGDNSIAKTQNKSNEVKIIDPNKTEELNRIDNLIQKSQFIPQAKIGTDKIVGSLNSPEFNGRKFVLRVQDDPNEAKIFNQRMNNEIAAYKLTSLMNLDTCYPLTAKYNLKLNDTQTIAYIQEIKGVSLEDKLNSADKKLNSKELVDKVVSNKQISQNLIDAIGLRMLFAEWDNHMHNFVIDKNNKIYNIDLEHSFKNSTNLSYGKTLSRVGTLTNDILKVIQNQSYSPEFLDKIDSFSKIANDREQMSQLRNITGLSAKQLDSFLGRVNEISKSRVLPTKPFNSLYVRLFMLYHEINRGNYTTSLVEN